MWGEYRDVKSGGEGTEERTQREALVFSHYRKNLNSLCDHRLGDLRSIQRALELSLTFNSYPASSKQEETSNGQEPHKSRLSLPLEV